MFIPFLCKGSPGKEFKRKDGNFLIFRSVGSFYFLLPYPQSLLSTHRFLSQSKMTGLVLTFIFWAAGKIIVERITE
jgi:hypothetical protein